MSETLLHDRPDVVQLLYSKIVPYRVEFLYDRKVFEIFAFSEHFDLEISPVGKPPEYRAVFNSLDQRVKFEVTE